MPWSTMSNAFEKSRYTMSTEPPASTMCKMSSKTFNKADKQECPLLNPCCALFRQPFLSIKEETCFLIIFSGTLLISEVSEIGWLLLGTDLSPDLKTGVIAARLKLVHTTPEESEWVKSISKNGDNSVAQFYSDICYAFWHI